jgi:phosphoglycolate phosphatase
MNKSLFFDLDGTLWDALIPLTQSWNDAMEKAQKPFRFTLEKMKSYMGLTPVETVPLAFPGTALEEGLQLFHTVLTAEVLYLAQHPGKPYPSEEKILAMLSKEYPLYIVSNSGKGYVENYLKACHMAPYFQGHICAGDTGKSKAENIRILKERIGIEKVIYIGDTQKDKTESEKAGVPFIHAAYGFGTIAPDPYRILSLSELPPLVAKLFASDDVF